MSGWAPAQMPSRAGRLRRVSEELTGVSYAFGR